MSTAGPPQAGAGSGISGFLTRKVFGLPMWAVGGIAIVGGVGLAIYLRRGRASASGTTLGQSGSGQANDPNIDPNTGVPYSVEDAIDPNTGLPAYFDLYNGGINQPAPPNPPGQNPPLSPPPNPPPPAAPPVPVPSPGAVPPSPGRHPPPGPVPIQPIPGRRRHPPPQPPVPGNKPPPGRSPPPIRGGIPYEGAYGGSPQATPWWPIPYDVSPISGSSVPGIPESPGASPPGWPWFNPWSGGLAQPIGPAGPGEGPPDSSRFDVYNGGINQRI